MSTRIPWYDADQVVAEVTPDMARRALRRAIEEGLDPAADPARQAVPTAHGQLLLMPASSPDHAGVKVASVAPGNPELGKPRIQAVYVLLDAQSLTPIALMDGTALTTLRTPAVSAVAVDRLADGAADRLVVFGSGPQAWGHIEAIREIRRLHHVTIVGRDQDHAQALVDKAAAAGLDTGLGQPSDVADADMIVCATSSPTPLFDGSEVAAGACVAAIGAHLPD
ncbi:MAG: ornithine cyclodeaminase family protein, partial [Nocardioidaceae bacterium]